MKIRRETLLSFLTIKSLKKIGLGFVGLSQFSVPNAQRIANQLSRILTSTVPRQV
jgi:hypothetical protein